jgi:hypothetical protein
MRPAALTVRRVLSCAHHTVRQGKVPLRGGIAKEYRSRTQAIGRFLMRKCLKNAIFTLFHNDLA